MNNVDIHIPKLEGMLGTLAQVGKKATTLIALAIVSFKCLRSSDNPSYGSSRSWRRKLISLMYRDGPHN
jgi:hypothetical protein